MLVLLDGFFLHQLSALYWRFAFRLLKHSKTATGKVHDFSVADYVKPEYSINFAITKILISQKSMLYRDVTVFEL